MNLLEFGKRFLNFKGYVMIVNNATGKCEFQGMFMDCPYRFLRFSDVKSCEVDKEENKLIIYVLCNSSLYYDVKSHFADTQFD